MYQTVSSVDGFQASSEFAGAHRDAANSACGTQCRAVEDGRIIFEDDEAPVEHAERDEHVVSGHGVVNTLQYIVSWEEAGRSLVPDLSESGCRTLYGIAIFLN